MKMKKVLACLLVAAMSASLAACGGSGDSSEGGSAEGGSAELTSSDEPLTVAIWDSNQEPGLREIMDDFTEETGIEVDIQITPWSDYWTMLEAATTGGAMPDVFWMHSDQIGTYAEYDDILLNLSDLIEESDKIDLANYPESLVTTYQNEDGDQLAIPKDIDTCAVWYNKTMFDEAGIAYPEAGWTWDDFREIAKQLTKADGSQYGTAIKPGSYQESWYSTIYAYGGEVISEDKTKSGFDDPKTIEGMQVIENIIKDGSMPDYSVVSENETTELMENGTVAMTFQGSWSIPELANNDYIKENCDCAVMPMDAESGRRVSIYNGLGWAAAANGDNTENAWKLIEYLGSEEAQVKQAELGVTMSAWDGTSEAWVNCAPEFNLQAYLDMRDDMVIRPYSRNTVTWENRASELLKEAWAGNMTMEDTCKQIAEEMNATLAEEQ